MFSHEKLKVYQKALASARSLAGRCAEWDRRHAMVDHLMRSSESTILNLAEGARVRNAAQKQQSLDYAIGSALESAACIDIATLKQFISGPDAHGEKSLLCEIVKMLIGLRKSWEANELRDDSVQYGDHPEFLFPHEQMDVYRASLDLILWFHALPGGVELSNRLYRQFDKAATSVVLNIAERNGRYGDGDRRRFVDIAESSAVKAATYLDLCAGQTELNQSQMECGAQLLRRIASMLRGLAYS